MSLVKWCCAVGLAVQSWSLQAVSLIPSGSLDASLADIEDTGVDAFGIVVPVVITIAALLIAVKLVKRFISKAG